MDNTLDDGASNGSASNNFALVATNNDSVFKDSVAMGRREDNIFVDQ